MQTYFFLLAALLYAACAVLPSSRARIIAGLTGVAWLAHAVTLWFDLMAPGTLRFGFSAMLSAALWVSVGAYWIENRNFSLDGLRRMVMPSAVIA
ncbi:MAG: inner membrane protein YpjD, partial [Janthinobacterium sp.]